MRRKERSLSHVLPKSEHSANQSCDLSSSCEDDALSLCYTFVALIFFHSSLPSSKRDKEPFCEQDSRMCNMTLFDLVCQCKKKNASIATLISQGSICRTRVQKDLCKYLLWVTRLTACLRIMTDGANLLLMTAFEVETGDAKDGITFSSMLFVSYKKSLVNCKIRCALKTRLSFFSKFLLHSTCVLQKEL